MAFANLYNYPGIVYTMGLTLSKVDHGLLFLPAWTGWIDCFLNGSDTSSNSLLFGNLQVVVVEEIGVSTVLIAATHTAGVIISKMFSPQTLTGRVSIIGMYGKEGRVLLCTTPHSILFVCLVGALSFFEQYVIPGIITPGDEV